jgi:hypothetical protein
MTRVGSEHIPAHAGHEAERPINTTNVERNVTDCLSALRNRKLRGCLGLRAPTEQKREIQMSEQVMRPLATHAAGLLIKVILEPDPDAAALAPPERESDIADRSGHDARGSSNHPSTQRDVLVEVKYLVQARTELSVKYVVSAREVRAKRGVSAVREHPFSFQKQFARFAHLVENARPGDSETHPIAHVIANPDAEITSDEKAVSREILPRSGAEFDPGPERHVSRLNRVKSLSRLNRGGRTFRQLEPMEPIFERNRIIPQRWRRSFGARNRASHHQAAGDYESI